MGLLHDAGLAEVYIRDIAGLNPLLDAMGQRGMPVDGERRLRAAQELEQQRVQVLAELQAAIPPECFPKKVYKKQPKREAEVTHIAVTITYCAYCGARKPNKKHTCFKTRELMYEARQEQAQQWVVRLPFVPSPKGYLTYFKFKGYKVPQKYDRATGQKRATTDEAALLRMALTHEDPVLALALKYRDIDKQLSTYIGRPDGTAE